MDLSMMNKKTIFVPQDGSSNMLYTKQKGESMSFFCQLFLLNICLKHSTAANHGDTVQG